MEKTYKLPMKDVLNAEQCKALKQAKIVNISVSADSSPILTRSDGKLFTVDNNDYLVPISDKNWFK